MKSVAAIIVAAGASSRLGQPKQLLVIAGETMLQRTIRIARSALASPVFVVLGADHELIRSLIEPVEARVVINSEWQEGLASSIRAGVRAAEQEAPDASGLLLMVCDQPRVTVQHLHTMFDAFTTASDEVVVASSYAGTRGIPAVFPRSADVKLCALSGDRGARALLHESIWTVVEIPLEGGEIDIDCPEDLDRIR